MKLSRYKHDSPFSYTLGATLSYELLKTNPQLIRRVFLRPDIKHGDNLEKILSELRQNHIEIIESTKAFNILNAKDNCLLIAEFTKPSTPLQNDPNEAHIVLVNPSDTGNLGTIVRTAAAFGYHNLAIITPAVDPYDPKTIRASMGAIFHLNIAQFHSFEDYLAAQSSPRRLYSFMLNRQAQTLAEITPEDHNYALIFGNEAAGLPKEFAQTATPIFIPQSSNVDSLNLSVAASIAMYHFSHKA